MRQKFTLEIELGNAAMRTAQNVADAVLMVAKEVDAGKISGAIRDINGNAVGEWAFETEGAPSNR